MSLQRQTRPPAAVWVIADNCTDATADVARANGANVYTTVDNQHRKAGGLNQMLARLLPTMGPLDVVLVMDADTIMVDEFLERAMAELEALPELDAVGGMFYGDSTPGLLGRPAAQRIPPLLPRHRTPPGKVFVLTGTASLFRADALAAVAEHRGSTLPGSPGQVYDTISLTEDNELTLALKTLGARLLSPASLPGTDRADADVAGPVASTGTLAAGCAREHRDVRRLVGHRSVLAPTVRSRLRRLRPVLVLWPSRSWRGSRLAFSPSSCSGLLVGLLFAVERTVTVWEGGWRARLVAAPLLIELGYAIFLQAVYVKSLIDIATGRSKEWNSVVTEAPA